MNPTIRIVLSWLVFGVAGVLVVFQDFGLWIVLLSMPVVYVLRYALKPRMPDASQHAHPVLSLCLIVVICCVAMVFELFFRGSEVARIALWSVAIPIFTYFLYNDLRIAIRMQKAGG